VENVLEDFQGSIDVVAAAVDVTIVGKD